uniref:Uncharacterized protein n=1 Tax=Fagus sylvatica TaxID=28930 RepID=A0A2N9EUX0_FAGSY
MAKAFVARFITNSRKRKEMNTLLAMKLEDNETLKNYSIRFWETYNDIEACGEEMAIATFKMGLPIDSGLRKSLVKHPPRDLGKLMYKIDQFVRIKEDGRGTPTVQTMAQPKATITKPAARTGNTTKNLSAPKNFVASTFRAFETVFKEPIYKVMEKIKREPFFVWPPKMLGNPALKDGNLYCSYHREKDPKCGSNARQRPPPSGSSFSIPDSFISSVTFRGSVFGGTSRGYQEADQGSFAEVMYQDLYEKLGLDEAELSSFTTPIFGFSGEPVIPLGKTVLPVLAVPSTLHQKLRFPTVDGVMELNGDQVAAKQCVLAATKRKAAEEPRDASSSEAAEIGSRKSHNSLGGSGTPFGIWSNPRSTVPSLALEYGGDQLVDSAFKACSAKFPRCLPGISSDPNEPCRSRKDSFYHIQGNILLQGRTVEVYIDDMLIKSLREENHLADLLQVFDILRKDNLCLNASKCTFGVGSGKFLGHVVSRRGIEANPDQIAVLMNLAEPRNIKQNVRPPFRRSRLTCQLLHAFQFPIRGNHYFCIWWCLTYAVSAVLVRELVQEQKPIFFVSKAIDETELRYLPLEKAALALLHAAKKLPHYFQSSTVTVLSDLPLKMLLQRSDFTGRITRWGVYLGSLGVEYKPRTAIKGQVLAEFLAEFQYHPSNPSLFVPAETQLDLHAKKWELFVDGASNSKGSGAGIVLISPEGLVLEQAVRLKFSASNNEAEYEAMLIGLRTANKLGANHLQIFCDSQLVANQISGEYQARDDRMSAYLTVARTLLAEFDSTHVAQIGREHNSHTDILAKLATALESDIQRTVCIETLDQPSFQDQEVSVCSISSQPSWMDPILSYLKDNKLPEDRKEAKMIKLKAPRFWVSKEGLLYRRSFTGPYLLCVHPGKVKDFLFEIHEGICGSHTGGRSLAHRAISQGYWWPYMQPLAICPVGIGYSGASSSGSRKQKILDCCNRLFYQVGRGRTTFRIFRDVDTKRFLWKNIITRFGIPWAVISDNGTQFESRLFKGFCSELSIRNFFSSSGYPQSNGQAKVSNKVILNGIKRKLEAAKGKWVEELPSILWTYRTTVRKSTNETPFALAFGVEAVIPLEIGMPTIRTTEFAVQTNEDNLRKDLDLVEERRDLAMVHLAAYQQRMKREHNKNVKPRTFQIGDLVLRKVMANTRRPNEGKLGPNWEGPYKVLSQAGHGAYRLEDLDGKPIPRPWNTCRFVISKEMNGERKYCPNNTTTSRGVEFIPNRFCCLSWEEEYIKEGAGGSSFITGVGSTGAEVTSTESTGMEGSSVWVRRRVSRNPDSGGRRAISRSKDRNGFSLTDYLDFVLFLSRLPPHPHLPCPMLLGRPRGKAEACSPFKSKPEEAGTPASFKAAFHPSRKLLLYTNSS